MKRSLIFVIFTLAIAAVMAFSAAAAEYIVEFTPTDPGTPPETEEDVPELDPVIIKLGDDALMKSQSASFYRHGDELTEGIFTPAVEDGISCIKLTYAKPTEAKLPEYRFMVKLPKHPGLTEYHKYMRVTFKTDSELYSNMIQLNNGNRLIINTLIPDASVSKGEWIRTNAADITVNKCLDRFLNGNHTTIGFYSGNPDLEFCVSEIALFTTREQAYTYYGDIPRGDSVEFSEMTFGDGGTATLLYGDTYGVHSYNEETQSLDITYAEKTNAGVSYMAKIKFKSLGSFTQNKRYMRVLYSAKNPDGINNASMYLRTDARANVFLLKENIEDTNGKFVLSDVSLISQYAADRFAGAGELTNLSHNSLIINTTKPGGLYSVKAVYFFSTLADAEAFTYDDVERDIDINGVPIENYKIVISEHPTADAK